jgi:hypothetical protein
MALNVLRDAVFTVIPGGADDGTWTGTTAVTVLVDTVTVSQNSTLEDHSTAQNATPLNRITKIDWEVTIETKMSRTGSTGLENVLQANELVGFTAIQAGTTVLDVSAPKGIVSNVELNYAGPNTIRCTIKPYGDPLTLSFTAT